MRPDRLPVLCSPHAAAEDFHRLHKPDSLKLLLCCLLDCASDGGHLVRSR